jgi:electron transfer flavoprotein beta subunit
MNIVVCVKRVPMTQEVDLQIDPGKKRLRNPDLAYVINDWDNYAVEEAVRLKEQLGGTVTAVTVGSAEDEEVLRRALAMGADMAIRVEPGDRGLDGYVISRVLSAVIKPLPHDLVLTGVQAEDDNCATVGIMLAEQLVLPHAAVVTHVEVKGGEAAIRVELEGGMDEVSAIRLPALLTIQTGINEPRYVSIMGIRKAAKKELRVTGVGDLGLSEDDLTPRVLVEELFLPPETAGAAFLEGDPSAVAEKILAILKEKGVSV